MVKEIAGIDIKVMSGHVNIDNTGTIIGNGKIEISGQLSDNKLGPNIIYVKNSEIDIYLDNLVINTEKSYFQIPITILNSRINLFIKNSSYINTNNEPAIVIINSDVSINKIKNHKASLDINSGGHSVDLIASSKLTINGGLIKLRSSEKCFGIHDSGFGSLIINKGLVLIIGGNSGIGIGTNSKFPMQDITINNGIITIIGGCDCPGIGTVDGSYINKLVINDGTIAVYSQMKSPAIGSLSGGIRKIEINGGEITATGSNGYPDIGSINNDELMYINIENGKIYANGSGIIGNSSNPDKCIISSSESGCAWIFGTFSGDIRKFLSGHTF